ncbi:MAG: hypothetical protein LBL84_00445 [Candidatus Nomurabacteria bacterium]|jgi:hypothetical protein|nr:hypothetical protein [Candidatus Nomurabacteria bacterium]
MAQEVAIKKVQAISQAGRNMFIAVALASVVVGFSIVGSIFLIQKMIFNAKVIGEMQKTSDILHKNNETIVKLADEVKVLEQNSALRSVTINSESNALRTIPDALPAVNNPFSLGASVMVKLLTVDTGIMIDSFTLGSTSTDAASGQAEATATESTEGATEASDDAATASKLNAINFQFEITGNPDGVSKALQNLERSIRQIDIATMEITYNAVGTLTLIISARGYYISPPSIDLGEKEVKS